jgi:heme-degrading monooxygenase HmoA
MATIDASRELMTLINTFEVEPGNADALIEALARATRDGIGQRKGFISASLHKSEDGSRVVNYAQWESKADFQAMLADPEAQVHMRECAGLAKGFSPVIYTVAESLTR